jgi:hypothetical protein
MKRINEPDSHASGRCQNAPFVGLPVDVSEQVIHVACGALLTTGWGDFFGFKCISWWLGPPGEKS